MNDLKWLQEIAEVHQAEKRLHVDDDATNCYTCWAFAKLLAYVRELREMLEGAGCALLDTKYDAMWGRPALALLDRQEPPEADA